LSFEFFTVITVDEALARWRRALAEHVPVAAPADAPLGLADALGMVLAADVRAADDVPGFDRSTVDGYAVDPADTFGASEAQPAYLRLAGEAPMGEAAGAPVPPGCVVRVATGGMLPPGAGAAVMLEHCETLPTGEIAVSRPAAPGDNVIRQGEDLRTGDLILVAGHRLRPQDLGLLAAAGVTRVEVRRRPRVAVVSTGDEVVPPDAQPGPGQVRDINSYSVAGMVREAGGEPVLCGVVSDDPARLDEALRGAAAAGADLLLVSGGSSVGARDYVARAIAGLGAPGVLAHGIALRPGKPTLLAVAGSLPVIGLPGHPASAMVVTWLFGVPALRHLAGDSDRRDIRPAVRARLTRNLPSAPGREEYVRVALRPEVPGGAVDGWTSWAAEPVFGASGLVRTLVRGDGLVRVPHGSEGIAAGTEVDVYLFGGLVL
jgi:molybdopterin molybdotransferase